MTSLNDAYDDSDHHLGAKERMRQHLDDFDVEGS